MNMLFITESVKMSLKSWVQISRHEQMDSADRVGPVLVISFMGSLPRESSLILLYFRKRLG